MDLTGKVAIITGGANGIGREISKTLASYGAIVVVNYHSSSDKANQLIEELKNHGLTAYAIKADIGNKLEDLSENLEDKVERFSDNFSENAKNLGSKVGDLKDGAYSRANDFIDKVKSNKKNTNH